MEKESKDLSKKAKNSARNLSTISDQESSSNQSPLRPSTSKESPLMDMPPSKKSRECLSNPSPSSDYLSCEEDQQDFSLNFKKFSPLSSSSFNDISEQCYPLSTAIDYIYFDSNLAVAIFPGCIRFGPVISHITSPNHHKVHRSFEKNNTHEVPICEIKKFVFSLRNFKLFLTNHKPAYENIIVKKPHKEVAITRVLENNKSCFLRHIQDLSSHDIKFENLYELVNFARALYNILQSITEPNVDETRIVPQFLDILSLRSIESVEKIFKLWTLNQKEDELWDVVLSSIELLDKEKVFDNPFKKCIFTYFKKNIQIIFSMYQLKMCIK